MGINEVTMDETMRKKAARSITRMVEFNAQASLTT
jgi:quinolinate synthase